MRILAGCLAALAFAASACAQDTDAAAADVAPATADIPAGRYVLDPRHASLLWQVKHMDLSYYTARFTRFTATLDINPAEPETARLTAVIDPTSVGIDLPGETFDAELRGARYFNAASFPEITFTSTSLEMTSDTTAKVTGDLAFLGVTKPVTLDAELTGFYAEHPFSKKGALGFHAEGTFARSDFGLTTSSMIAGDEVRIIVNAEFQEKTE